MRLQSGSFVGERCVQWCGAATAVEVTTCHKRPNTTFVSDCNTFATVFRFITQVPTE